MNPQDFSNNENVKSAVERAGNATKNKPISDIIDDQGHQYVDIVMEGGGVLGFALAGYIYTLEQAGVRFLGIGGTSAGSINALLLAALGPPQHAKSAQLLNIVANMPLSDFIDGDDDARDFSKTLIKYMGNDRKNIISLVWKGAQTLDNFREDLGLNPGKRFHQWLKDTLDDSGIQTTNQLMHRLSTVPDGLKFREGNSDKIDMRDYFKLALVASDITTETKVDFPRMAGLYWENPGNVCPADYVRASMSVPLLFHPFRRSLPKTNKSNKMWIDLAGYYHTPPEKVLFVDGGIMSNFPIDLFHKQLQIPKAPTFGAKLGNDRFPPNQISTPLELASAIFDSARHTHDFDFITRNPDYRLLVTKINVDGHAAYDFNLQNEDKIKLFSNGAESAATFLAEFDWQGYKALRRSQAKSFKKSLGMRP